MTAEHVDLRLRAYRLLMRMGESWRNRVARRHPHPLFVFGNQKSGTSAIAALLGSCTDLDVAIDFPAEIRQPTVPEVRNGRRSMDSFIARNRHCFAQPIIKEPAITFIAEQVLETWPQSSAIFVIRHPFENIRSILDRLRLDGDLPDLAGADLSDVGPAWMTVLDNRWQGCEQTHYIEQLAARWLEAVHILERLGPRVRLVRYEDFEADKAGVIRGLARSVGLEPLKSIDDLVDVQYQPRGRRGRSPRAVYGANLDRIVEICWPAAARYGYDPSAGGDAT